MYIIYLWSVGQISLLLLLITKSKATKYSYGVNSCFFIFWSFFPVLGQLPSFSYFLTTSSILYFYVNNHMQLNMTTVILPSAIHQNQLSTSRPNTLINKLIITLTSLSSNTYDFFILDRHQTVKICTQF